MPIVQPADRFPRAEPPARSPRLTAAAQIAAAGLAGFGLIMVIAANWAVLGPHGQTALIATALGLAALSAALFPSWRVPGLLVTFAATGGLLAHLGMIYQTGGDTWQLFALWAAVTLPLAIAARHDAVWTPWTAVAFTTLPLWLIAVTGQAWGGGRPATLAVWLLAGVLVAVLSPWARLEPWLGRTTWAFRLATVQFLVLVTTRTIVSLWSRGEADLFFAGVLLVVALLALLMLTKPLDFPLFAIGAIAADVILISFLWRLVGVGNDGGAMLFLGLLSTGIVVATARLLMVVASRKEAPLGLADWWTVRDLPAGVARWPAILLSAVGAWFAAIPFVAFYFLVFGKAMSNGLAASLVGIATIAGGAYCAIIGRPYGFGQIFGLIAIVTGKVMLAVGFATGAGPLESLRVIAFVLLVSNLLLLGTVPVGWLATLFGFSAAIELGVLLMPDLKLLVASRVMPDITSLFVPPAIVVTALGGGALLALPRFAASLPASVGRRLRPFLTGWLAACLLAAIALAGPTFLVGATVSTSAVTQTWQGQLFTGFTLARLLAVLLALGALWLASTANRDGVSPTHAAGAAVAVALAYLIPPLAIALAVLAVMLRLGSRAGIAAAILAALWCLGSFYYALALPLMTKGLLLLALGLGLGVISTADGLRLPVAAPDGQGQAALPSAVAYGLIAASIIATGAFATNTISSKELVLRDGRQIFVQLAPVDPRSLMQGDFMALRFVLPRVPDALKSETALVGMATIDGRGLARVTRIAAATAPPVGNERPIALTYKAQWTIATDAFFFKEGTGKRYETARYGIFKLADDGTAVLVGLADDKFVRIE